jgi:hypothetical protein
MKLKNFKILDREEQMQFVEEYAVFLCYRTSGIYNVALFQLEGFYIELFYDIFKLEYKKIKVFEDMALLEPYMELIDISELCY